VQSELRNLLGGGPKMGGEEDLGGTDGPEPGDDELARRDRERRERQEQPAVPRRRWSWRPRRTSAS